MSKILKELRSCPYCGNNEMVTIYGPGDVDPCNPNLEELDEFTYLVVCKWDGKEGSGCGASTAYKRTEHEAVAAWNRRADGWVACADRMPEDNCVVFLPQGPYEDMCTAIHVTNWLGEFTGWLAEDGFRAQDSDVKYWYPTPPEPPEVPV
ncbi:hypothetical protein FACS1894184_04690 [Clostridia bacterium]|nr:hypothetical protein FACS1894184_04690 [Clostridia bacterium]